MLQMSWIMTTSTCLATNKIRIKLFNNLCEVDSKAEPLDCQKLRLGLDSLIIVQSIIFCVSKSKFKITKLGCFVAVFDSFL